ncbi:glycosyltransferase family 2 protein [Candidatus Chloroploca sp. Khr17]|uniref:glycosyltransferase family 2 protein n=1 Tax=Candidatus Chloroploca sp. Khr17 TaxID=2496869 RepID=UPI00101C007C|nr:glycosyltransferase family 2 protein [Candidatus Chloroploca sp. Khr17]
MTKQRPRLSAVIPTWQGLRYLPACLSALRAQLGPDDEIILVDNASRDQAGAWAQRHAPDVQVVTLPTNLGFAGGTNAGLAVARGELLLLINDDALAEPGCVAALWHALSEHPHAGAAAGILTFSRHPERIASAGITVRRDGVATDRHPGLPINALPTETQPIFGASGGLALLRRAMLDDIGPFETSFFNYLEDVDLAWRAQLRNWTCVLAPDARARHVYSATSGQGSPFKQRLLGRNRIRVLIRCLPTALLRECLPAIVCYDMLATAYALVRRQPAMIAGRLEAMRELPMLRQQRQAIQAHRTASINDLATWLIPAPSPLSDLRIARQIERLSATT